MISVSATQSQSGPLRRRVLVVDDRADARKGMVDALSILGFDVLGLESSRDALRKLETQSFDLILSDLMMPGMDGLQFLAELHSRSTETPVIMVTAHGTVATAVQAMRQGAFDYLEKPFDINQLEAVVNHALEQASVVGKRSEIITSSSHLLVGESSVMKLLKQRIELVAASNVTVLITGESGTGKELVARSIHCASARKDRPLVSLNCPSLSASLMESELFGHEQGAFTNANKPRLGRFELADTGTIFLDEVTEIELSLQAKLLRVIQEQTFERVGASETRKVDVRVIAATNRDIVKEVEAGRFRHDLYFRLAVVPINVPPLRERLEDLPLLANHLLEQATQRCGRASLNMSPCFIDRLASHSWPGNVRELENVLTRVAVLTTKNQLTADDLNESLGVGQPSLSVSTNSTRFSLNPTFNSRATDQGGSLPLASTEDNQTTDPKSPRWDDAQRQLIEATLAHHEGHRERTAEALGISVRTLSNKLRAWGYRPRQASYRTRKSRAA